MVARVVAVVDAFDAMTTNRAYRTPRGAGRGDGGAGALRRTSSSTPDVVIGVSEGVPRRGEAADLGVSG